MTFPHTASISRSTKTGTKYLYSQIGTTECFLQPLDSEESKEFGAAFGKASVCYVPYGTDVAEGDEVSVDGVKYGLRGLRSHNYGSLPHKRLILEMMA